MERKDFLGTVGTSIAAALWPGRLEEPTSLPPMAPGASSTRHPRPKLLPNGWRAVTKVSLETSGDRYFSDPSVPAARFAVIEMQGGRGDPAEGLRAGENTEWTEDPPGGPGYRIEGTVVEIDRTHYESRTREEFRATVRIALREYEWLT